MLAACYNRTLEGITTNVTGKGEQRPTGDAATADGATGIVSF